MANIKAREIMNGISTCISCRCNALWASTVSPQTRPICWSVIADESAVIANRTNSFSPMVQPGWAGVARERSSDAAVWTGAGVCTEAEMGEQEQGVAQPRPPCPGVCHTHAITMPIFSSRLLSGVF
jgi:hypothetical protein